MNNRVFLIIFTIIAFGLGAVLYVINPVPSEYNAPKPAEPDVAEDLPPATTTPDEPVFCTADAKMCPDGSFVGRTGPNCEFAPCPQIDNSRQ